MCDAAFRQELCLSFMSHWVEKQLFFFQIVMMSTQIHLATFVIKQTLYLEA